MAVMDRFLNAMRLNSDEEDDYYEEDFYDEEDEDEDDFEDDYDDSPRMPFFRNRRGRDEDYDDEDEYDDDDDYAAPERSATSSRSYSQQTSSKVTPMRSARRSTTGTSRSPSMEVCVIKPISVEDSREITDTLLGNRTVILNLEGLDIDIAQRIIDFTSGSCYAVGGSLQKISNYIFVVTPANVDISGDIQNIMSAFGGATDI